MNSTVVFEARGLTKRYGGTDALCAADLVLTVGEVHCLVGENGAGKSTLGKMIAGVVKPDNGVMLLDGEPIAYRDPRDALAAGITIVEQELALVPAMTVAENVVLGLSRGELRGSAPKRRRARSNTQSRTFVQRLIQQHSLDLDADAAVETLGTGAQQKVEILRALARRARVIVMDEPTARLTAPEAQHLLSIIRTLAQAGTTIVYVTHFLDEVLAIADRITVLRNGRVITTTPAAGQSPASLVSAMLGREVALNFPAKREAIADQEPPMLSVRAIEGPGTVRDVSFAVRPGEIVGVSGLVGSGRSQLARLIFGADAAVSGEIEIGGRVLRGGSTSEAIAAGVAYLPESRKDLGLFMPLSNQQNVTASHLDRVSRFGIVDREKSRVATKDILNRLSVTPADPRLSVSSLSGGNQQKVLFGKWLWHTPRLLIVDEPTRGVDVGAKFAIYDLLAELAQAGMAILLISSEIDEIVGLADRVLVMARGRLCASLVGEQVDEERILRAAFAHDALGEGAQLAEALR
ncbi:MAG: ABC transporter [Pseudonocardiales bacterium]|nr:MAG: ABC transporter [Pseudonocardiales bacterium]